MSYNSLMTPPIKTVSKKGGDRNFHHGSFVRLVKERSSQLVSAHSIAKYIQYRSCSGSAKSSKKDCNSSSSESVELTLYHTQINLTTLL